MLNTQHLSFGRLARRGIAAYAAIALTALVAYSVSTWQREKEEVLGELSVQAGYLAAATQSWFDNLGNGLEPLGELLARTDVLAAPERTRPILDRFIQRYPGVGSMSIITPQGVMLINTLSGPGDPLPDFRNDPPYLENLKVVLASKDRYVIGPPEYGKLLKEWRFPFRYVVRADDGRARFVIQAAIPLERSDTLLRHLPLPSNSYIGLLREDGFQQARLPADHPQGVYGVMSKGPLLRLIREQPHLRTGTFAGESGWTGPIRDRIGAFSHLEHDPLYAYVSVPATNVLSNWWRQNAVVIVTIVIFVVVTGVMGYRIYLTERKHTLALLEQTQLDTLTGLPNRAAIREILEVELAVSNTTGSHFALLFIDLDRFKNVNDTLGHDMGDQLLRAVAKHVQKQLRGGDILARLGGDEFLVLSRGGDISGAFRVADRILLSLTRPVTVGEHNVFITPSIGIAVYPEHGKDTESLVKHADLAMYESKRLGRNAATVFNDQLGKNVRQRLHSEFDLRTALEQKQLRLLYQPIFDFQERKIVGAEALIRWEGPDGKMRMPGEFIGIAEETGLILPLGEWVFNEACAQLREWMAGGHQLWISVNLSARQFQDPQLMMKINAAISANGIDASLLELEITESAAMLNPEASVEIINKLSGLGCRISIDDFGTGYSSLSYLKRIPSAKIKIDRSFVDGLNHDPSDTAIARTIVALAGTLEKGTVAEGVESAEQFRAVQALGCTQVQGYWISRPVPAAEFWTASVQAEQRISQSNRERTVSRVSL